MEREKTDQENISSKAVATNSEVDVQVPADEELLHVSTKTVGVVCSILMDESARGEIKNWHSLQHTTTRDIMQQCISHLILQRRPESDQSWINKLIDVSKRVEIKLYCSANSIEE